ncbi:helix-turn-helix transcriptional regulator [Streptococcus suis]|uniref:helix-turn-helix transcriptional regulator n=1 Tax=Streptococcus suis TaxID=1307 RepID=UPI00345BFD44
MQVILPKEQVQEIQLLISNLIKDEIEFYVSEKGLDSPYLNKKQACQYLGISNNTLDSWIQKGLPVIRIGKTVRFDKNKVNHWIQKQ